ncbi:MAG: DASS family sodium-coupled anion symporter, partial [Pseudomonadota bacterium]
MTQDTIAPDQHGQSPAPDGHKPTDNEPIGRSQLFALIAGPMAAIALGLLPPPGGLEPSAWYVVAITTWMVIWWLSEAIPLPATALIPIPLMPLLGVADAKSVTANYAHPLIFLFLGGFMLAAAMQKSGLHKRIALNIIAAVGTSAPRVIGGFMLATAFLSMWISNTATTIMMYAVGVSVIQIVGSRMDSQKDARNFAVALLLGIAYSASIGGVGTLIGTPPNALLASVLETTYQIRLDFVTWMMFGIPVVIVMLPIAWVLLTQVMFPVHSDDGASAGQVLQSELNGLGQLNRNEAMVLAIFLFAALGWVFGKQFSSLTGVPVNDTAIAITAALLLYALPSSLRTGGFLLDWSSAKELPWGILLIFGGGLAIAQGFHTTGLASAIGESMKGLDGISIWLFVLLACALIVLLTEVTSNTASAATFLPILGAIAVGLGQDPLLLMVPVALGASMAFMMPVATPPNAIVFSYDELKISDMVSAGIWLNLAAVGVCFGAVYLLA